MKIVLIGRTSMLYNTALKLLGAGHKIGAVITAKSPLEYTKRENDFRVLAKGNHFPFFLSSHLGDAKILKTIKGSEIGISINWISIFNQKQIECFKMGILNAHMGDLPKYRGNACPNWAILNGEKKIIISIHLVETGKLDCGRIIVQDKLKISHMTYIGDIYKWAEQIIPELFSKALSKLQKNINYTLKYADIKSKYSFRCYPRRPEDSRIVWASFAEDIHRLIRASSRPFSGAYGFLDGEKLTIWKAEPYSDDEHYIASPGQICKIGPQGFVVITGKGKLKITEWECSVRVKTIRQRLC
jgi:methionyl-tRNA formyltransferase